METQELRTAKKYRGVIRRNEALQATLYEQIASLTTPNYPLTPTPRQHVYPIYMPALTETEPAWEKLFTLPQELTARVVPHESNVFLCAVELVHKRDYIMARDVYLPDGDELVVKLQPAFGQLRRHTEKFVAVVVPADVTKARAFRTVELNLGQMLIVEG